MDTLNIVKELIVHECIILIIENYDILNYWLPISNKEFKYVYLTKFKKHFYNLNENSEKILTFFSNNLTFGLLSLQTHDLNILTKFTENFVRYQFINEKNFFGKSKYEC